jgi:hypothetical protein
MIVKMEINGGREKNRKPSSSSSYEEKCRMTLTLMEMGSCGGAHH